MPYFNVDPVRMPMVKVNEEKKNLKAFHWFYVSLKLIFGKKSS